MHALVSMHARGYIWEFVSDRKIILLNEWISKLQNYYLMQNNHHHYGWGEIRRRNQSLHFSFLNTNKTEKHKWRKVLKRKVNAQMQRMCDVVAKIGPKYLFFCYI